MRSTKIKRGLPAAAVLAGGISRHTFTDSPLTTAGGSPGFGEAVTRLSEARRASRIADAGVIQPPVKTVAVADKAWSPAQHARAS